MGDIVYFVRFLYSVITWRVFVWLFFIVTAAALEGLGVSLFIPILAGEDDNSAITRLITRMFEVLNLEYSLSRVLILIVVLFLLRTAFLIYQQMYAARIVTRLLVSLKSDLVDKIFKADYQHIIGQEIGFLINAVTIEYSRVAFAFETCMNLSVAIVFALIYFSLPLAMDPIVTGAVVVLFVPGYFLFRKIATMTRKYSRQATANNARLNSYLIQALNNFKYLKATFSGAGILGGIYGASQEQGNIAYRQSVLSIVSKQSTELFLVLMVVGLLFNQVVLLGGELVAVLFLLFLFRRAIVFAMQAAFQYRDFLGASGSIKVFRELESELSQHSEDFNTGGKAPDFEQPITFRNVSLSYGEANEVLKGVDLTIRPRQTVALVGASGAGKSTLVTLLTGILRPDSGEILMGNEGYLDIDQIALRRGIGYVTQESVIFNDTISNNITLWSNNGSDERLNSVVARAYLKEFIDGLPDGFGTVMGDGGLNVSGGQRQRISIARELFKDVKLLIFDEATSSLDTLAEQEIQGDIDEFQGEKTVVIVAHRLSTVRNSDWIYVLKDGEIVEEGPYADLYSRGGEFKTMVDRQTLVDVGMQGSSQQG